MQYVADTNTNNFPLSSCFCFVLVEYVIRHDHDGSVESNNRLLVSTHKTLEKQRQAYRNLTSKCAVCVS